MSYRLRKQAFTGKLVLMVLNPVSGSWADATEKDDVPALVFTAIEPQILAEMFARLAQVNRRAAGQRKAYAEKKAKQ